MARMVKVLDDIYCLYHECVHIRNHNPYDYSEPECEPSLWRSLYWKTSMEDIESGSHR